MMNTLVTLMMIVGLIGMMAVGGSANETDVVTGVESSGDTYLVKRFTVPAGATIVGVEFLNNDDSAVFPRVALHRGPARRLAEATVVAEATTVVASSPHRVRVLLPHLAVEVAQEVYVSVRFPAGEGATAVGSGAGIAARQLDSFGDCYVAATADQKFQPINVDLAITLLYQTAGKAEADGEMRAALLTFLATPSPNPSTAGAQIQFGLDRRAHVKLGIYNVAGRLVRLLAQGPLEPGLHSIGWDGRDEHGQRVAAGIYVAKMRAGAKVITQKVVVMK